MLKSKTAKEIEGLSNLPLEASELRQLVDNSSSYFDELKESAKENELYLEGINLTKQQKKAYHNKERGHFPIPIVSDKLSRIIQSQRNARTSAKAEAIKPESEITSELITLRFRKIEKDSNMEYTESEIFTAGVGVKFGVGEICVEKDIKGNNVIIIRKRDYQDFIWDSNAREYDKSDGAFMGRKKKAYRLDIRRDFGDKIADAIDINDSYWGREGQNNWGIADRQGRHDYDVIYIYCMYVKVLRTTYHVVFGGDDIVEYSRADAEKRERLLKLPYIILNQEIPESEIVEHTDFSYDYYETTFNQILKYEQTELEAYPYEVYQAFHFEDKIWCMTDLLKPGNKLMDKLLAQIDYAIGTDVKNGWELVTSWLETGITVPEAIRKIKAGEPLPVIRPGALNAIKQRGFNAQWMEILSVIKSMEDQFTGGDLYSGVREGKSRESENAIALKLKQQELIASLFIDNLRRWKRNVFKKVIWYLKKYDTAKNVQKIYGSALSPEMKQLLQQNNIYTPSQTKKEVGWVEYNNPENELTILKNAEVEVYVVEESLSDTAKLAQFNRMVALEKMDPDLLLSQTWRTKKLELIDEISFEDRAKIIAEITNAQQAQAQQAQAQQQFAQSMAVQDQNIKRADILVKDKGQVVPSINNNGNK